MQEIKSQKPYYLGLDICANSIGYAVTDENYNILKYKGEPMWGVNLFDSTNTSSERRGFRHMRRSITRRKWRVRLLQSLFEKPIAEIDANFFIT